MPTVKDFIPPILHRKASQTARYIAQMFGIGAPVWTQVNFESLAKEGFQRNVWVYRCIMAVAQAAAGVDWVLYNQRGGNRKEIEEHPLLDLINTPNPYQSKFEFFEAVTAFQLLAGNAYIEKVGPNVGPPKELYALRPDRMEIMPDSADFIAGYVYTVVGQVIRFEQSQVMHIKRFHATDDYYGLSPIQVAARSIDNDNAANSWNNSLLNNGARPSGAMVTKDFLTDEQYNRLDKETKAQYTGAKNAGKYMLLEGGLDWKEMGLSPKDMDFIESKKISRVEICTAFGVPPEVVGDKEHATYSNYQEARKALYEDAVLPALDLIRDKLNAGLVKLFGPNLYLDYDRDSIEALQENADVEAKRAREDLLAGKITLNEARDVSGYEATPNGDVFYVPSSVVVIGVDGEVKFQPPAPAPGDPNKPPGKEDPKPEEDEEGKKG